MGLAAKMVAIMRDVTEIKKNAKNNFHNYEYVNDVAVYHAVRKAMVEHGVAIYTKMNSVKQEQGEKQLRSVVEFTFVLVDPETDQREECNWYAEGEDKNDKGINKAATAALKYFLLKTFVIPSGDDPDADEPDDGPRQQPAPRIPERDNTRRIDAPAPGKRAQTETAAVELFDAAACEKMAAYMVEQGMANAVKHATNTIMEAITEYNDGNKLTWEQVYKAEYEKAVVWGLVKANREAQAKQDAEKAAATS